MSRVRDEGGTHRETLLGLGGVGFFLVTGYVAVSVQPPGWFATTLLALSIFGLLFAFVFSGHAAAQSVGEVLGSE